LIFMKILLPRQHYMEDCCRNALKQSITLRFVDFHENLASSATLYGGLLYRILWKSNDLIAGIRRGGDCFHTRRFIFVKTPRSGSFKARRYTCVENTNKRMLYRSKLRGKIRRTRQPHCTIIVF